MTTRCILRHYNDYSNYVTIRFLNQYVVFQHKTSYILHTADDLKDYLFDMIYNEYLVVFNNDDKIQLILENYYFSKGYKERLEIEKLELEIQDPIELL